MILRGAAQEALEALRGGILQGLVGLWFGWEGGEKCVALTFSCAEGWPKRR